MNCNIITYNFSSSNLGGGKAPTILLKAKDFYSSKTFEYLQNLYAKGEGINLKIGAIVRVNENIKIGGALHTPTVFTIQEEFRTITQANFGIIAAILDF